MSDLSRFVGLKTLDEASWNAFVRTLATSIAALEDRQAAQDLVVAGVVERGLGIITEQVEPLVGAASEAVSAIEMSRSSAEALLADVTGRASQLGLVFTAASTTPIEMSGTRKVFVVPAASRASFLPLPWLEIAATGDWATRFVARLVDYDRDTGALTVDPVSVAGTGTRSSWWIGPVATVDVSPVLTVAGRSGTVILDKADVGLPAVEDIAPADMPVSIPQAVAISGRLKDMVVFTDFFSTSSKLAEYRDGGNPDITQELADMDAALAEYGQAHIPLHLGRITATVEKKPGTWWRGMGSIVVPTWTIGHNGVAIDILGVGVSREGGISNLRLLGDTILYPDCVAIDADGCFTHHFEALRIGNVKTGIQAITNSHALYFDRVYTWSCADFGIDLRGETSALQCTDHWISRCQLTGDVAGLYMANAATPSLFVTRPQGSGIANAIFDGCFDVHILGHYCDSAVIHPSGDGANGVRFINCQRTKVIGVAFYSNGAGDADLAYFANGAQSSDHQVIGCSFVKAAGQSGESGITIHTPTDTGFHRRVIVSGCNFIGVDTPISGMAHVDSELHVDPTNILGAFGDLEAVTEVAGGSVSPTRPHASIYRLAGTAAAYNFILPAAGNYVGRRHRIVRASGTGGIISVCQPSGAVLTTIPATANAKVDVVCITSSSNAAAVSYSVIGT